MKQAIVTGGRYYKDESTVYAILSFINPDLVIQGGASGADLLAKKWADTNQKQVDTIEADWAKYGKAAGPYRNKQMLDKYYKTNTVVIAFPGNRGTEDCVNQARRLGYLVLRV